MATTGAAREDVVRIIHGIDREFMNAVTAKDAERVLRSMRRTPRL